jgi:uncharacterized protein (DUF302 family)
MRFFACFILFAFAAAVNAQSGMIKLTSTHSVAVTTDRLAKIVTEKGFTVVARINHAAAAKKIGTDLRPTELLIFGNPKVGSALMSSQQSVGIDLPVKVLVWQAEDGTVWVGYNDPAYLVERHSIGDRQKVVDTMSGALKNFTKAAAGN